MRRKIIPRSNYPIFLISFWCKGLLLKPEQSSTIEKIYHSDNKIDFITGPRATGKSIAAYCYAIYHAIRNPKSKICLTSDTRILSKQANNFILDYLCGYFLDKERNCYILSNGSEIYVNYFMVWENKGHRYDLSVIDLAFSSHKIEKLIVSLAYASGKIVIVKEYSPVFI